MANRNWQSCVEAIVLFFVICTPFEAAAFLQLPDSVTRRCAVCGPPGICEMSYHTTTCRPPNNYCVNHIVNKNDGSRTVERKCANFSTCTNKSYVASSSSFNCTRFDKKFVYTLQFECTYCCTANGCNSALRPSSNTLYHP